MRRAGHWLRFIGLMIEMVGVVGVVRERGGHAVPQISIPGGPVVSMAWAGVALGFVLWLIGKVVLAASRPTPRDQT